MSNIKVDFFNVNTGETVYLSRPAQLKAAIESSDLSVNRPSDRGWRIGKEWKNKLRQVRATDKELMNQLAVKYGGEVTESQLLIAVFAREMRLAKTKEYVSETGKFEQEYNESIAPKRSATLPEGGATYTPTKAKKSN